MTTAEAVLYTMLGTAGACDQQPHARTVAITDTPDLSAYV